MPDVDTITRNYKEVTTLSEQVFVQIASYLFSEELYH